MITLSEDARVAEQQMHAIIFYLTTFGHIDGDFDPKEREFVRNYIRTLVEHRAKSSLRDAGKQLLDETVERYTKHFHEVFEGIDARIQELLAEPIARDEDPTAFVQTKLKQRCFEIFQSFDDAGQEALMGTIDELLMADGIAHPAELQFRGELAALLGSPVDLEFVEDDAPHAPMRIDGTMRVPAAGETHPFFVPSEIHYAKDGALRQAQVAADRALLDRVMGALDGLRATGNGLLTGKQSVAELAGQKPFLDGHTYVVPPASGRSYELTVLGDLHGCYSVLKATLMQSRFFEKVDAFRADPTRHPEPRLVLLGDYIDRGLFSLNGVLRVVLQLAATAPEHVHVLRGNHEYYIEYKGKIYGGVRPSESIDTLKPHVDVEVFRHYARLFEALPNTLLFDRFLFTHGGIPRDRTVKEKWRDLSSLNDPDIRFQMMWSDPSTADVIPADLQDKSARFAFGRMQARAFLQRLGCDSIIRGHEKVDSGFHVNFDDGIGRLMTLFSAGGADNDDLPAQSSYRSVTPMALTIRHDANGTSITPWAPDYRAYNDPERNAFFRVPPELAGEA